MPNLEAIKKKLEEAKAVRDGTLLAVGQAVKKGAVSNSNTAPGVSTSGAARTALTTRKAATPGTSIFASGAAKTSTGRNDADLPEISTLSEPRLPVKPTDAERQNSKKVYLPSLAQVHGAPFRDDLAAYRPSSMAQGKVDPHNVSGIHYAEWMSNMSDQKAFEEYRQSVLKALKPQTSYQEHYNFELDKEKIDWLQYQLRFEQNSDERKRLNDEIDTTLAIAGMRSPEAYDYAANYYRQQSEQAEKTAQRRRQQAARAMASADEERKYGAYAPSQDIEAGERRLTEGLEEARRDGNATVIAAYERALEQYRADPQRYAGLAMNEDEKNAYILNGLANDAEIAQKNAWAGENRAKANRYYLNMDKEYGFSAAARQPDFAKLSKAPEGGATYSKLVGNNILTHQPFEEDYHWDYMTDDERATLYYLYNTQGEDAAKKYMLEYLGPGIDEAYAHDQAARIYEETQNASGWDKAAYSMAGVFTNAVAAPMSYLSNAGQVLGNKLADGYNPEAWKPVNSYGEFSVAARNARASRQAVADGLSPVGSFLYQTGMSKADNLVLMPTGQAGTLALMGLSAADAQYAQDIDNGVDPETAVISGAIAGGIEILTETASLEHLFNAPDTETFLRGLAKQAFFEGTEEGASDVLNLIREQALYGETSYGGTPEEHKAWFKELLLDMAGGALSGGVMYSGFGGPQSISKSREHNAEVGGAILGNGNAGDMARRIGEFTGKPVKAARTNRQATRQYEKFMDAADAKISETMRAEDDQAVVDYYRQQRAKFMESAGEAESGADGGNTEKAGARSAKAWRKETGYQEKLLRRAAEGKKLMGSELDYLDRSPAARETLGAIKNKTLSVDRTKSNRQLKLAGEIAGAVKGPIDGTSEGARAKAAKRAEGMRVSDEGASVGGEQVKVNGITRVAGENGEATVTVTMPDGSAREVDMGEVTFSRESAELYSYAADMASREVANAFRTLYTKDQDMSRVAAGMDAAYDMGRAGYRNIETVRKSTLTSELADQQLTTAYELGVDARTAEQNRIVTAAAFRAKEAMGNEWRGGQVTYDNVNPEALSAEQRRDAELAAVIAGLAGKNVELFESQADESGRYVGENGSYDPKTNTIRLDVNAGRNHRGDSMAQTALLKTMSHELTHDIQHNASKEYERLRSAILDVLESQEGADLNDLVDAKLARDKTLRSREAALDEVVADACEGMLRDSDFAQRMQEAHPEAVRTLGERLRELLGRIMDAIKAAFNGKRLSREANMIMREAERYREIADMWAEGAQKAAEVTGRLLARESGNTESSQVENAEEAEKTANEGEKVVPDVREYPAGDEARRLELLNERDGVKFSMRDGIEFVEDKYYARLIDRFEEQKPDGYIKVGKVLEGSVLNRIGLPAADIYFDNSKINKALHDDHGDHIDTDVLKQIPRMLREPLVIAEAKVADTVNVFGDVSVGSSPVMVGIVITKDRGGRNVINKVRTIHARRDYMTKITDESVLYLHEDKKRTRNWFQARGNVVPLGGTKFGFIRSISLSDDLVNPEMQHQMRENDRQYLDAVERGDMAEAERMVYEMAEDVMWNSKVRFDNDEYYDVLTPVYHATDNQFTVFDRGHFGDVTDSNANDEYFAATAHLGFWFNTQDLRDQMLSERSIKAYLNIENPYKAYSLADLANEIGNIWDDELTVSENAQVYLDMLKDDGYDGIQIDDEEFGGTSFVAFEPSQIKSAEAVAYDDAGNVIPLSERFNAENDDIRYQPRDEQISIREMLANVMEDASTSADEMAWLKGYRKDLKELDRKLDAIGQNKQIIRELMFKKGRTAEESRKLGQARERLKILQEQVTRMDEGLLKLEGSDFIRGLVNREVKKIRDMEAEKRRAGIAKVRETQRNAAVRKNIRQRAKRLDRMLREPTDRDHIPEGLKGAMIDLMDIFTRSDDSAFGGTAKDRERLYRAQSEYMAMQSADPESDIASRYDEDTADRLRQLGDLMNDGRLTEFGAAELAEVSKVLEHFEHLIRDQNDEFRESRRKKTEEYAREIWQQTGTMKGRKENAFTGSALVKSIKHMGQANVTPVYFYKHLGGAMGRLGNDLLKAEGRYGVNAGRAEARISQIKEAHGYKSWAAKKGDILRLETESGEVLELTREQALGIWASAKRERTNTIQRAEHLRTGGVILEKAARKAGLKGQELNLTPTKISENDIAVIDGWLTDQQKKYADAMVNYISTDMAELGNETSMELVGYKKFGEGYYYPYKTSSDFRRTNLGNVEQALIKNMGFTKATVRNAKTPVVITDFSQTVSDHVNAMLMYNAFAAPQDQLLRAYDFKLDDSTSVKNMLRSAYGDEVPGYIEQQMRDLYGGVSPDRDAGLVNRLISGHKRAAVLGSASVVIQQPTAIFRAMCEVNPKYFGGRLPGGGFEEAKRYAGTAVIKDMGGFDTSMSRGATDWLNGNTKDRQNHPVRSTVDKINELAGMGAEKADQLAWSLLWKAVKKEQADVTGLDINSEELKQKAGERFDEVVRLTQVYDSVMSKSQLMRNKNVFWKGATAFMAEPTVTWNMMLDMVFEARKGSKKKAGGIFVSVLASTIFTNLAKALVTASRDDDDEEATWLERYVKNATDGLINDLIPFNYVPIARDVYSKLQGYDVERTDMSIINDILAAGETILNPDSSPYKRAKSGVQVLSLITGVPAHNLWREVEATINTATATPPWKAREGWLENAVRTGLVDATPIGKWFDLEDSKARSADKLFEALMDGDAESAGEWRKHLMLYNGAEDEKAVDGLLRGRIKEGYENGELDSGKAVDMLTEHAGMKRYDAEKRVAEWSYAVDTGTAYSDVKAEYMSGNLTDEEAIAARVEYGGADEKDAAATVAKWRYEKDTGIAYGDMAEAYISGDITEAQAIAAQEEYGGLDAADAKAAVKRWNFEKESGIAYANMKDAYISGELTEAEAIAARMEYGGAREAEARQTVAEWRYEKETGDEWSEMKADYIAGRMTGDEVVIAQVKYGGAFENDVRAQLLKWDYERDTGMAYTDMKGAYLEGGISREDAVDARMKYGGLDADAAELDVSKWDFEADYGYGYDDMRDYYELGRLSGEEAIAAQVKYGKTEEDKAYFNVAGWEYEQETGGEWNGKFTKVHDAVDSGSSADLISSIQEVYDHSEYADGKKAASAVTSNITSTYKPIYLAATPAQRAAMEPQLLTAYRMAYELAGEEYYGDEYKLKQIRKWAEE